MLNPFHKFARRIPRLWKLTGGMVMAFSLAMTGLMQGVKLLDLPGCMALYVQRLPQTVELDLYTGRYINNGALLVGQSEDGNHTIYIEPVDNDSLRILVASEGGMPFILQEGVTNLVNWQWDRYLRWSADGQQVAYVWVAEDSSTYLSIANADGSAKRTVPFAFPDDNTTRFGIPSIVGWSPDNAYLMISTEVFGNTRGTKFTIWSVADLQPLSNEMTYNSVLGAGVWSPIGHRFAVLARESGQALTLFLMTPEGESQAIALPDPGITYFNWSPDGRYLMFAGLHLFHPSPREFIRKWVYHLYSSEGESLYMDIVAARISTSSDSQRTSLNGLWSSDGDEWWFLQERQQDGVQKVDLVALNLASGLYKLVALDIPQELAASIFFTKREQLFNATLNPNSPENPIVSQSPRLLVPSQRGGKLVVDLLETATHKRTTLVEGADRLIDTRNVNFNDLLFWSWDGVSFVIVWSAGEKVYLTMMKLDGSYPYIFDGDLQGITQLRYLYDEWIGYTGWRGDEWSIELINRSTHEHRRLMNGIDTPPNWEMIARQDFQQTALILREDFASQISQLYLSLMDGQQARQIDPKIRSYPWWSPDGTRLAYLTTPENAIDIVSSKGELLQQVMIPRPLGTPLFLGGWTGCEMTSL